MIKRRIINFIIMLLPLLPLRADVNSILDEIYSQKEAPLTESIWLVLAGAGEFEDTADLTAAEEYADSHGFNGINLTRGQLALLLVENFEIPSGIMYKITKSPRYALRDIISLDILGGMAEESKEVSGFELVNSLSIVMEEEADHE